MYEACCGCLVHVTVYTIAGAYIVRSGFILFDLEICRLATLLVPFLCCSEWWSLQPAATDENLLSMEVRGCKFIGIKTVDRSRTTISLTDSAKVEKIRFCSFKIRNLFYSKNTGSHMFCLLGTNLWVLAFTLTTQDCSRTEAHCTLGLFSIREELTSNGEKERFLTLYINWRVLLLKCVSILLFSGIGVEYIKQVPWIL
jgi:hypothetical protein